MINEDDIMDDPENRDTVITVLNALDGRIDAPLRTAALIEIATTIVDAIDGQPTQQQTQKAVALVGCLIGISIKICDEHKPTTTIDAYREIVRNAAQGQ